MEDVDEMKINQVHSGNEQVEKFQIGEVKGNLIYIDIKPISFHTERRKVNAQEVEDWNQYVLRQQLESLTSNIENTERNMEELLISYFSSFICTLIVIRLYVDGQYYA